MTRRDTAFLLIGTSFGLTLGVCLFLSSFIWMHHMFILGFTSYVAPTVAAFVPLCLGTIGAAMLMQERRTR